MTCSVRSTLYRLNWQFEMTKKSIKILHCTKKYHLETKAPDACDNSRLNRFVIISSFNLDLS